MYGTKVPVKQSDLGSIVIVIDAIIIKYNYSVIVIVIDFEKRKKL